MKRTIAILCLSDIHFDDNFKNRFDLDKLMKLIGCEANGDISLQPDYIVVAGDIINAAKPNKARNYYLASKFLENLSSTYNIPKRNIVIAPGNHDKNIDGSSAIKTSINKMWACIKGFGKKSKKKILWQEYDNNFKLFYDFYHTFIETKCDDYDIEYNKELLGDIDINPTACTSMMKIFHKERICFVTFNTEWDYSKKNKGAEFRLEPQLVRYAYEKIRKQYADYTIITVMHRHPSFLNWAQRNQENSQIPDVLSMIADISDIILTGHEHIERTLPPDYMHNKVQVFKLGSTSVQDRSTYIPLHNATLMILNPIKRNVKSIIYAQNKLEWDIVSSMTYKLKEKYNLAPAYMPITQEFTTINAKSFDYDDILSAIKAYYKDSGYTIYAIDISNITSSEFDSIIVEPSTNLVIYHKGHFVVSREHINTLTRYFYKKLVLKELIMNEVVISVPYIALN